MFQSEKVLALPITSMDTHKDYLIIFVNKLIRDVSYDDARQNLINTFHFSEAYSDKLFTKHKVCISKTNILENALKAVDMIKQAGFESKVVKRKDAKKQLSAHQDAFLLTPDLKITRHIDSLKSRAEQLKEKLTAFKNPQGKTGQRHFAERTAPPVPANVNDYLNPAQQKTVNTMQKSGWEIFFVRRADPKNPITVMVLPSTGETARVEINGSFNLHHEMHLRH